MRRTRSVALGPCCVGSGPRGRVLAAGLTPAAQRCSLATGLFHICPHANGGFHFAGHVYLVRRVAPARLPCWRSFPLRPTAAQRAPGDAHDRRMIFDFWHEEPEPFSMVFPLKSGRPVYVQKVLSWSVVGPPRPHRLTRLAAQSAGSHSKGMLYLEGEDTEYEWENGVAVSGACAPTPHPTPDALTCAPRARWCPPLAPDYTASWADRETRWKWASLATRANVTSSKAGAERVRREARVGFHLSALMYEIGTGRPTFLPCGPTASRRDPGRTGPDPSQFSARRQQRRKHRLGRRPRRGLGRHRDRRAQRACGFRRMGGKMVQPAPWR